MYCSSCKFDDMIDVMNKKCIVCNLKQPHFNYQNEKSGLYSCKLENMVNILDKMCINCKLKRPTVNYPEEKDRLYCNVWKNAV